MSLKQKTISGTKWTTVATVVIAIASIIKLSVLARFLEKEDFGLMALVNVVLGFMTLFMDMGLTSAILHKQKITKSEYSSLYWLNIIFSFFLMLMIMGLSPLLAIFFDESELTTLLILMSLSLLISAFGRQFKTIKQKSLEFKFISIVDISSILISLLLSIILAILGYGVYSLVYSALLNFILTNTIYLAVGVKSNPITLHFNIKETETFLKIGIYQVGGQVINYFNRDIDTLIVGKVFGAEILGGYSLAKQLVFRPASLINPILTKVASPVLAKIQNSKDQLKTGYLKLLNIVSTLNFFAYLILLILAYPIVLILYGNAFLQIVSLVQLLSIYMYLRSLTNPIGSLVIATGRTDLEFYWNCFALSIMPIFIFTGAQFNVNSIALGLTIFMFLAFYPFYKFVVNKLIDVSFKEYLKSILVKPSQLKNNFF